MSRDDTWVADPRIGWRILLTARLRDAPDPAALHEALAGLCTAQSWAAPGPVRTAGSLTDLYDALVAPAREPVLVGRHEDRLVVSAHHSAVDGLGLLTVLDRLGFGPVATTARGVGDRGDTGGLARTAGSRLAEVAVRPPARVTPTGPARGGPGDVLVRGQVPGSHRTAALVHAATRAVMARETAHGRRPRHVAIAVGAARSQEPDAPVRDRSVLLRLRDVERLDLPQIAQMLRTAPVQTPPVAARARPWTPALDRLTTAGLRVLGPRLGSTLLVSHLGDVTASRVADLSFHPVTAGGSGLSLGAVGLDGSTTLTLRARAAAWTDDGLEQLLEAVISLLAEEPGVV